MFCFKLDTVWTVGIRWSLLVCETGPGEQDAYDVHRDCGLISHHVDDSFGKNGIKSLHLRSVPTVRVVSYIGAVGKPSHFPLQDTSSGPSHRRETADPSLQHGGIRMHADTKNKRSTLAIATYYSADIPRGCTNGDADNRATPHTAVQGTVDKITVAYHNSQINTAAISTSQRTGGAFCTPPSQLFAVLTHTLPTPAASPLPSPLSSLFIPSAAHCPPSLRPHGNPCARFGRR